MTVKVQTLETPSGRGKVYDEGGRHLRDVNYRLRVTQTSSELRTFGQPVEWVPGAIDITGVISDAEHMDMMERYVLHLAGGRRIEFLIKNSRGDIVCSGDFF